MAISGVTFILCENYYLLLLGAVVGVISRESLPLYSDRVSMLRELYSSC